MKYKLSPHVTDEILIENGFEITQNSYGQNGFDDCFEAIRTCDERYKIVIQDRTKELEPMLYDVVIDDYIDEGIEPFIQDLIEKGLVFLC